MNTVLKTTFQDFAQVAAPYLHITDEVHYKEALELVEALLAEAKDNTDDPINGLIEILAQSIACYENKQGELVAFDKQAYEGPADVATLRAIMLQHGLGVADFPEIGDKSLVSRILSGSRNLTKQHIQKLSDRFGINPAMFFD